MDGIITRLSLFDVFQMRILGQWGWFRRALRPDATAIDPTDPTVVVAGWDHPAPGPITENRCDVFRTVKQIWSQKMCNESWLPEVSRLARCAIANSIASIEDPP